MQDSLTAIKPKLIALNSGNDLFVSEAEIQAAAAGLSEKDIVPYLELVEKIQQDLKSKENGALKAFNQKVELEVKQQVAAKKEEFDQQVTQYKNQLQVELDSIAQEIQKSNSPIAEKEQLYNQKAQEQSAKLNNYQQNLENKIK